MAPYAVTVSPRYIMVSPDVLHRNNEQQLVRVFNKFSHHYILYPEFDSNSRLHYHGIVEIDDLIKFHHVKYLIDRIGFTKIDKLKTPLDKIRWLMYCQKNYASMALKPIIYIRVRRLHALSSADKVQNSRKTILQYFNAKA